MKPSHLAALTALLLLGAGCNTLVVAPHDTYPTHRTFKADHARVWQAALSAMERLPLTSVDRQSGVIITDWMKGTSDHRFVRRFSGMEPLKIRFKLLVRVESAAKGVRVRVVNTEYTAYQDYQYTGWSSPRSVGHFPGHPSPYRYVSRGHYVRRDNYVRTPSSTAKEKALLDRIEATLRSYYRSQ